MARNLHGPWFRVYTSILNNRKFLRLNDAQFAGHIKLMAVATDNGGIIPPDLEDVAKQLRKPEGKVRELMQVLISLQLMEQTPEGFIIHDWEDMQFQSDVSTNRVRAFRERQRNVSCNANETALKRLHSTETETETETEKKEERAVRAAPAKGTRWPPDKVVPEDWLTDADIQRHEHDLPRIDLRLQATRFANYWASKSGGNATKTDWHKTWINWALDDTKRKIPSNGRDHKARTATDGHLDAIAGLIDEISHRKDTSRN